MAWKWMGLAALCLLGIGCSSSSPPDKPDASTIGVSCSTHPSACTLPPAPGNEPPNKGGTKTVIAISKLYLGDTDAEGKPDPNAWKSYGYNLDGLITKATDENHCKPNPYGNPLDAKTDGNGGIDNSFGANVTPILVTFGRGAPDQGIADGKATVLFRLDNLLDPDKAPDQNGITGAIYEGADKGSPAAFDGSDVWPVTAGSVNGSVDAPKVTFSGSYVSGGVWVSHGKPDLLLPISTEHKVFDLPIHRAVITMRIHGTGVSASAVDGRIGGVVDPDALTAWVRAFAVGSDPNACSGSALDSMVSGVPGYCDIMSDETNGDPAKTCNAISIGVGFEGHAVTLGAVAPPVAPPPEDPCDAGPEAGSPDAATVDAGVD